MTTESPTTDTPEVTVPKIPLNKFAEYYKDTADTPESDKVTNPCLSVSELVQTYLYGLDLTDPEGNPFPKALLVSYLNSSISFAESLFDITLAPKVIQGETHDYERGDYNNWGYIQLWKRPIRKVTSFQLMYGTRPSMEIPLDWLKIDKNGGKIQLFPNSASASGMIITDGGIIFGLQRAWSYAPQLWSIDYEAGMDEVPHHLKELIYKHASIGVLQVWGDLILGAGIASSSVSIDGLSQSIGTTQSAMYGGASARIDDYRKDIESLIPVIRQKYEGIRMVVV